MPFSICKKKETLVNFQEVMINRGQLVIPQKHHKKKMVLVLGATGTGKSRLSIDLAIHFNGEIINSDKIQVYKGLDLISNKVNDEERKGVPHHLLGIVDPNTDFTADDFVHQASIAIDTIIKNERLPIIAGGSSSFINALVNENMEFRSKYDCCFLWMNVSTQVLDSFLAKRVDKVVEAVLVEDVKELFEPNGDYTHGIRCSLGVAELHEYFRSEHIVDGPNRAKLLEEALHQIKANSYILAHRQLQNTANLVEKLEWRVHRLDATEVFVRSGAEANEAWERVVTGPSTRIVGQFLSDDHAGQEANGCLECLDAPLSHASEALKL